MEPSVDLEMCQLTRTTASSLTAEDTIHSIDSSGQERSTAGSESAGSEPTVVSQPLDTQQEENGRFGKILMFCGSGTCHIYCLILFFLNVLQVLGYLLALFVVQSNAYNAMYNRDWDYISDHLPDRYIDYEFLENLSVL